MPIVALWFLISGARKGSAGTALAPVAFFLAWGVIAGINYISVIMDNRPKYMDKLPEQFIENIKKSNLILIGENNWHAQAIRLLGSELVKEFTATTKKSDGRVLLEQARIGKDGECKGAIIPNSQKYLDDAGRPDECFFIVELGSYPDGALLWFSPSSDGTETTGYFGTISDGKESISYTWKTRRTPPILFPFPVPMPAQAVYKNDVGNLGSPRNWGYLPIGMAYIKQRGLSTFTSSNMINHIYKNVPKIRSSTDTAEEALDKAEKFLVIGDERSSRIGVNFLAYAMTLKPVDGRAIRLFASQVGESWDKSRLHGIWSKFNSDQKDEAVSAMMDILSDPAYAGKRQRCSMFISGSSPHFNKSLSKIRYALARSDIAEWQKECARKAFEYAKNKP